MQECKPLPLFTTGATGAVLIQGLVDTQAQYKDCRELHKKTVDALKQRELEAP